MEAARTGSGFGLACGDWFPVLTPYLAAPLFSPRAVERLKTAARRLPAEGLTVFEARLVPADSPVDLSIRVNRSAAKRVPRWPLPSQLREFLSLWSDAYGPLSPVRSLWLELDLDRPPPRELSPIPCAELPRGAEPGWLMDTLLPALRGRPLAAGQRERIRLCLEALPSPGYPLYVFDLSARGNDAVRLEFFGLDLAILPEYLDRVAPRSARQARDIAPLFTGTERLHLSLDLDSEVLPRIGIEGSFPRQPGREPRWNELFGRLESRGLCSAAKRDAALAWPGYDTFWTAAAAWPMAAGAGGYFLRRLSHVKVACEPDRIPEAKAYLAFELLERSGAAGTS